MTMSTCLYGILYRERGQKALDARLSGMNGRGTTPEDEENPDSVV